MPCILHRLDSDLFFHAHGGDGSRMAFAEPGVGPHYGPDRTVVIEHIDLFLSIDPAAQEFSGEARIALRPLPAHKGQVSLDLDEVDVDAVEDDQGRALKWRHDDRKLLVDGFAGPGVLVVKWHVHNPRRGLYFTGPTRHEPNRQQMAWTQCQDEDAHFLMPCHDHPGVKHSWTIELEGPVGYTLLSNGAFVEQGERSLKGVKRAFARFEQKEAMAAYLFTAVCAKLTSFDAEWRGRSVRYLVPVGEEEHAIRAMGATPKMMEHFSKLTGVDYPWPRYDQVVVHDFIFGGMENIACTTMTRVLLVDDKAAVEWDPETHLVSHELAHQWFGDLVTCQDWSQGWLNESWATFMEAMWAEEARPPADATWYRHDMARGYFEEESTRYRRPIVSYDFREPIDVFDRHLYEKGACVLATLRAELGDDGFWAGVRQYLNENRHGSVHTRNFQRALEQATGRNLDRFFQQWVLSAGHPTLTVKLGREDGLVTVTVQQTQSGDGTPEAYHFGLRIVVVYGDGTSDTIDLPVRERERTWALPARADVTTVRVDPGFRVLARLEVSGPRGWIEALLADDCPVLACRAARALIDEGSVLAYRSVVKAMSVHPFHGVRGEIASMLGRRGGSDARDALLAALASDGDARSRRRMVDALGNFREKGVADVLIAQLGQDQESWHLEASLLGALAKTRDPRAREILEGRLDARSWSDLVAQRAVEGLAELEDPDVLDELIARTGDRESQRVRAAAARALGRLGEKVEKTRDRALERLSEMLVEPGFRMQLGAIAGLATLRHEGAVAPLTRVHRSAPDGRTRRSAYEALVHVRQGRTSEDALAGMRKRLDELAEENHALRQRIDKIER